MKIKLEQVYTLEFTMGLRYSPLQIRHSMPLIFLILLFITWFQTGIMESLPGDFATTKLNIGLIVISLLFYIALYPKKILIAFQNLQYLFAICFYQLTIFMAIKSFYFLLFDTIKYEIKLNVDTIIIAYVTLIIIWILVFILSSFWFRKRLVRGDFKKNSELQKKRSNLGLKLNKKVYILIIGFFIVTLLSRIIGGVMEEVVICLWFFVAFVLSFIGVILFPEHLFTAYCKFKFKEFHIEE